MGFTKGIISGHVDDFLFSGDETHEGWCTVLKSIQTEYKWGDWEEKRFTQCGVQVGQHEDFSFSLSQSKYVEDLKYINLRAFRKKDRNAPTEESEKTQLRALLGGVSWHAQQVAPHFSAEVGLLLSEVNKSTIETIYKANRLLDKVKDMKEHCMKVHAIEPHMLSLFAWVDAASSEPRRWLKHTRHYSWNFYLTGYVMAVVSQSPLSPGIRRRLAGSAAAPEQQKQQQQTTEKISSFLRDSNWQK